MAKLIDSLIKILRDKKDNLQKEDVNFIRSQYHLLEPDDFEEIGHIEEIIRQIEMIPKT
tara:strand:- start:78 stop:254 length:177 start_codon:yes stop_codon:yes gene_type:complete